MSQSEVSAMRSPPVPLATLIGRELRGEKVEKPSIRCGQAGLAKKGEDYFLIMPDCERISGNPSTSFSVFAVLSPFEFLFRFKISSSEDNYILAFKFVIKLCSKF